VISAGLNSNAYGWVAPSTCRFRLTGSCAASRFSRFGISAGMPAPISTKSTPASIAPYAAAGVASLTFSRKLMPMSPACPSLASHTSAKLPTMARTAERREPGRSFGTGA